MTSSGKMALISGRHLKLESGTLSVSMKAVFRVVLDVTEFSFCPLVDADRELRALLERFEVLRATSSVVDVAVKVSPFELGRRRSCSDEFSRLRLRLLSGGDCIETALLTVENKIIG